MRLTAGEAVPVVNRRDPDALAECPHGLLKFLDAMTVDKMKGLLTRLKEKTGHDWVWPAGPAPD